MARSPTFHDFFDEELLRVPLALNAVIDAVYQRWLLRAPHAARIDADPARALRQHRTEVIAETLRALRESAQNVLLGQDRLHSTPPAMPSSHSLAAAVRNTPAGQGMAWGLSFTRAGAGDELSLIEEDDVVADIEIARCTQIIKQSAEAELRELHTYTSSLVHDVNVARDTNPFGPERFVRAFWSGVQQLPLSRTLQAGFLHEAATPLAEALRQGYAAASRRLQDNGVAPAAYRTIVFGGGTAWGSELPRYRSPDDLRQWHDSLPAALDETPAQPQPAAPAAAAPPSAAPDPTSADPRITALLVRLFEALKTEHGMAPSTVALLQVMQPMLQRLTLHDTTPLGAYDHPVWRFMDQMAFDLETSAPAQLARLQELCRNLLEHLATIAEPRAANFSWASLRLTAARQHALAMAQDAAAVTIGKLQRIASDEASATTNTMPLDIDSLDTVPAELMPELHCSPQGAAAGGFGLHQATRAGAQLRCHLQGHWRHLTCLWSDPGGELMLLVEPTTSELWALRQSALARLLGENLARELGVRSLVRRAADRVLRAM